MKFVVIGITDNPKPFFPSEVLEIIRQGKVFSGGKRHHEIVAPLLPKDAQWIDITVPLDNVFKQYNFQFSIFNSQLIIVFASGDPLFFGFANTLQREFPDAELQVFPTFNSLQMLAHRMMIPYQDMHVVSLTGRPWDKFDEALICGYPLIGCLTDKNKTPHDIRRRMQEYGYNNYVMTVGENLGNDSLERVCQYDGGIDYANPNCIILQQTEKKIRPFGIPDALFTLLEDREKMITKMPIRLLTLQALELRTKHVLWDIGACTGSVSIEARLQFPHLQIEAFEIRPECEAIIQENARRFGAPGINVHIGDFLNSQLPLRSRVPLATPSAFSTLNSQLPRPDAVFIGGHGGRLKEIMEKVLTVLAPGGVIVMNSVIAPKVTTDSHQLWDEACAALGLKQEPPTRIQLDNHHPITILKVKNDIYQP
ncbi:MAG: precorrin-6y C5,15-methyltransferase (decarboxylating) subunit CbiE [Bacteroidaceae bacterium]|nr:precorrin-6y C5,15-methyltransferase (decarboxylating) subunit CbiE [Bacteroidaceae bacterium]